MWIVVKVKCSLDLFGLGYSSFGELALLRYPLFPFSFLFSFHNYPFFFFFFFFSRSRVALDFEEYFPADSDFKILADGLFRGVGIDERLVLPYQGMCMFVSVYVFFIFLIFFFFFPSEPSRGTT